MTLHDVLASASGFSAHRVHLLTLGIPTLAMALIALVADLRARVTGQMQAKEIGNRRTPLAVAATCSLVAMAIHASVAPEHFHEDVLFGVFFTVTAVCQLAWAILVVLRPRQHWLLAGAIGNAAIIGLWAYTRFVSLPLGPDAGAREEVGTRDVLATCVEVLIVLAVVWALVEAARLRRRSARYA